MTKEIPQSSTPECWFQQTGKCPVNGCSWDAYVKSSPGKEMGGNTTCIQNQKTDQLSENLIRKEINNSN